MANPVGRPPFYTKAEDMQQAVDKYFKDCKKDKEHPTVCGLALALGFCDRISLLEYTEKPEFTITIKKAKSRIESYIEQRLYSNNVAGLIFNLKNNFKWKDKTEVDITEKPLLLDDD